MRREAKFCSSLLTPTRAALVLEQTARTGTEQTGTEQQAEALQKLHKQCSDTVNQLREQSLENTFLRYKSYPANHSIETKMTIYISTGRFGL